MLADGVGAEAEAAETACRLETAADGVASEAEALGKGEVPGALQAAAVGGVRGVIERDTVAVVSAGVSGGRHGHDSTAVWGEDVVRQVLKQASNLVVAASFPVEAFLIWNP